MRTRSGQATVTGFPVYDGHGNMIATLGRTTSSPFYSIADERPYDAWGRIRSGNQTGDPDQRYCANLGHVQDDESGLIYMRARYYEPWTGKFVSEDLARDGLNWYIYCRNLPYHFKDESGTTVHAAIQGALFMAGLLIGHTLGYTIAILLFMRSQPGFTVDHVLSKAAFELGLGVLSFVGGLGIDAMQEDFKLFTKSFADMARSIKASLAKVGSFRFLGAGGIGLILGTIFGVAQATYELVLWRLDYD